MALKWLADLIACRRIPESRGFITADREDLPAIGRKRCGQNSCRVAFEYGTGWLADKGRLAQVGGDIMRAQLLGQAYTQALKFTVGRERPDGSNSQSFPSGHSASAFATATVLQRYYGWWVGVPATVAAGYVATARVHDNKHYLSDVIFGGAVGIAAQRTVMLRSGRYGFALNAAALPGGAGVSVSVRPR